MNIHSLKETVSYRIFPYFQHIALTPSTHEEEMRNVISSHLFYERCLGQYVLFRYSCRLSTVIVTVLI